MGYGRLMAKKKHSWDQIDWNQTNKEIARIRDCTVTAVQHNRKIREIPSVNEFRIGSFAFKISRMRTSGMPIKEVAKEAGCSLCYAGVLLQRLKKPYRKMHAGGRNKYDWSKADWSKPHREIARALGIKNPGVVTAYRWSHNLPYPAKKKRP